MTTTWAEIARSAGIASVKPKIANVKFKTANVKFKTANVKFKTANVKPRANDTVRVKMDHSIFDPTTDIGSVVLRCHDRDRIVADPKKPMFWGMCPASWQHPEMTDQQLIDSWQSGSGRGLGEGLFDVVCDEPI